MKFIKFSDIPLGYHGICIVYTPTSSVIPDGPITNNCMQYWNVLQYGNANRMTQVASEVFQFYTNLIPAGRLFVRELHDSLWSEWTCMASNDDLINTSLTSVPTLLKMRADSSVKNLNNLTALGSYYLGNTSGYSNTPITTRTEAMFLMIGGSTDRFLQMAVYPIDGRFYIRCYTGTWSAWIEK